MSPNRWTVLLILLFPVSGLLSSELSVASVEIDTFPVNYRVDIQAKKIRGNTIHAFSAELNRILLEQSNLTEYDFSYDSKKDHPERLSLRMNFNFADTAGFMSWFKADSLDGIVRFLSRASKGGLDVTRNLSANRVKTAFNEIYDKRLKDYNDRNRPFEYWIHLNLPGRGHASRRILRQILAERECSSPMTYFGCRIVDERRYSEFRFYMRFVFNGKEEFLRWYDSNNTIRLIDWMNSLRKDSDDEFRQVLSGKIKSNDL
jgi:hypothetical protein